MKTKNLIKGLFLILVSGSLFSCGYFIPANNIVYRPYIVTDISRYSDKNCLYHISNGSDYIDIDDDLTIIDSIGKFNINDTVYITLNKK